MNTRSKNILISIIIGGAIIVGGYIVFGSKKNSNSKTPSLGIEKINEDKDCGDFRTQHEAQAFFEANGGPNRDPHNLDRDKDSHACESLP